MYEAIITPVIVIRSHPNADRLRLATASGHQIICGLDQEEGQMGIFFPTGGQLEKDFLKNNNLYRHKEKNLDPNKTGLFDDNGRVRIQKIRGEISEGFWIPLSSLWYLEEDISLEEGFTFQKIKKHKICGKYFTPAMTKAQRKQNQGKISKRRQILKARYDTFYEQYNIEKLRYNINRIPEGAILYFSVKCHGTSARTGHLIANKELSWWQKLLYKLFNKSTEYWDYVTGTRRVVIDPKTGIEKGYYSKKTFRVDIHKKFVEIGIPKGFTLYYEIVGYQDDSGRTIMPSHTVTDSKLKKQYGEKMIYKYGCDPENPLESYKTLIYRITYTTPDKITMELPWQQVINFCQRFDLQTVPLLEGPIIYDGNREKLWKLCEKFSQGSDPLDNSHIKEGVCIRIEHPELSTIYKYKSAAFCEMESIAANNPEYIDPEDLE